MKTTEKPIVLYGTGNGAEKIMGELARRGITVSGVFASDDFVRGKTFCGMPVTNYAEAAAKFGGMIVLVCFGTDRPDVIARIKEIGVEQELFFPDVPVVTESDGSFECFDRAYADLHKSELDAARQMLEDEQSRKVFDRVVEYRLSGKIDYLFECETPAAELWTLLGLGDDESYLDLGAYTGDTIAEFTAACGGKYNKIYAFEPDARNFRKLGEYVNSAAFTDKHAGDAASAIELHNIAVSDRAETLQFVKNSGRGSNKGGPAAGRSKLIDVPADSVDNVIAGRACSVIKFDVEGQERKAINGARNTIASQHPNMIIAAYHRTEDLFAIPIQVMDICADYSVYLRHSPCLPAWEVNYVFVKK